MEDRAKGLLCFAVLLIGFIIWHRPSVFAGEADSEKEARIILDLAEVKPGSALCVHLGCGDGKLSTALARAGKFLVHGIAFDRVEMKKAQSYIQSQNIYGQVSVEYASLSSLPYADNLVNLIVAENNQQCSLPKIVNGVTITLDASGDGTFTVLKSELDSAGGSITFDALYYSPTTENWSKISLTLTESGLTISDRLEIIRDLIQDLIQDLIF